MSPSLSPDIKTEAFELRKKGYSLFEISKKLKISKSTASLWLKSVNLNDRAVSRIENIRLLARNKAINTIRIKIERRRKEFSRTASDSILKLEIIGNLPLCKLLCSLLYWGEGSKTGFRVAFINSDPVMIATFIKLFRQSFPLNESKFRALVHIHEYHNEVEIKNYWSKITNIPVSQFTKSYLKPHTGINTRKGYMGTIRIAYADTKIVDELKAVYNGLAKSLGM